MLDVQRVTFNCWHQQRNYILWQTHKNNYPNIINTEINTAICEVRVVYNAATYIYVNKYIENVWQFAVCIYSWVCVTWFLL